ncbi:hypothetical protein BD414DRAFT_489095 [Trametes punicea]|nr:hypothetical protein BD414DRAFT_489095 [Trametes punicea]
MDVWQGMNQTIAWLEFTMHMLRVARYHQGGDQSTVDSRIHRERPGGRDEYAAACSSLRSALTEYMATWNEAIRRSVRRGYERICQAGAHGG